MLSSPSSSRAAKKDKVFLADWAPGYTVISYLDKTKLAPADKVNLSVTWNKVNKKANEQANALAGNIGVSEVSYNRDLLRFYGIIGDNLLRTLYSLTLVWIIGTVVCSFFDIIAGITAFSALLLMIIISLYFTKWRYKEIDKLSLYLKRICRPDL